MVLLREVPHDFVALGEREERAEDTSGKAR
jgi:hypothetical protein